MKVYTKVYYGWYVMWGLILLSLLMFCGEETPTNNIPPEPQLDGYYIGVDEHNQHLQLGFFQRIQPDSLNRDSLIILNSSRGQGWLGYWWLEDGDLVIDDPSCLELNPGTYFYSLSDTLTMLAKYDACGRSAYINGHWVPVEEGFYKTGTPDWRKDD